MSEFNSLIKEYMNRCRITSTELAEGTGLGNIVYKYVRGTRIPGSPEAVEQISDYLNMSNADRIKIRELWRIEHFGADRIELWKQIETFLKNFQIAPVQSEECLYNPDALHGISAKGMTYLYGSLNVYQAILSILVHAGDAPVSAVVQPNDPQLRECLIMADRFNPALTIHNIVRFFPRSNDISVPVSMNLSLLQDVVRMTFSSESYYSYYYYSDGSLNEKWPLYTSYIVTEKYALLFGRGDSSMSGILTTDEAMIRDLKSSFSQLMQESRPLISRTDNQYDQMESYYSILEEGSEPRPLIQFSMQPCLCPFLSRDMIDKYINHDIPGIESVEDSFLRHMQWYRQEMPGSVKCIISVDGVRRFLDTGRLDELLDYLYSPISVKDRVRVVRHWMSAISEDTVYFLPTDSFPVQYGLTIITSPSYFTTAFISHGKVNTFISREPTISSAFWDYFSHIYSRDSMPFDEGISLIESCLSNAEGSVTSR